MASGSNEETLADTQGPPVPPAEQAAIDQAFNDVLLEFAACSGEAPDEDTQQVLREFFAKTIEKGIKTSGTTVWHEPHKSFALKYVCKVAKRYKRCRDDKLADDIEKAIKKASKACEKVMDDDGQIGLLCPDDLG